ncbi:MAG TPA: GNAT family N-acetyltransferase [Caulobacteraceae bacterium]|nr:GNAT family N-acetyltransferase [Caulobacteraceae bacterium]
MAALDVRAEVVVGPAPETARPVLANMMQLYIHDFSQFWAGTAEGELGEDGRFGEYPHLGAYWRESGRVPLLIRADGVLAGFALINAVPHSGRPADRNMAEFFIARKHRRGGVGAAAARAIFSAYRGQWEAAVARRNSGALAFWRKAIGSYPGVSRVEEFELADERWNGPILRFQT